MRIARRQVEPSVLKIELPRLLFQTLSADGDWCLSIEKPPCCARELFVWLADGTIHGLIASFGLGADWDVAERNILLGLGWVVDAAEPTCFEFAFAELRIDPVLEVLRASLDVVVGSDLAQPLVTHLSIEEDQTVPWFFSSARTELLAQPGDD